MRTLYHFPLSPFSRRVRLALAHKGLDVELRDARANPALLEEARQLVPFRTIPVLVDGESAQGDSTAIAHWLDRAYPQAPPLWPTGADALAALQAAALVDVVLNHVVDTGTRFFALHDHPAWAGVTREMIGRAQRAMDSLGERAASLGKRTIAPSGWSAADMWLFTLVDWFEGLPQRAATTPNAAQILTLGLTLPDALSKWADAHRARPDVQALQGRP
jgi:glutathione S-transferase